ncbi:MAG: histidine--tRNA ligase [Phycisphaerales bacterium]
MRFQAPRGTRDFFPAEMAVRRHIEGAWRSASIDFGFEEVDGPTFEHLDLYTVKSGDAIVSELFSFTRAGGEDTYALRPEFTPTLARMIASTGGKLPLPIKWFAIPNFFRAERPQRGRLREFFQWNVDLVGVDGPRADAEVIAVAVAALERLGLGPRDVQVKFSHRGAVSGILSSLGVPAERLGAAFELLDRRDKLEPAELARRRDALGLAGDAAVRFDEAVRTSVPLAALLGGTAPLEVPASDLQPLRALGEELRAIGLLEWCHLDLGIVRGLAYYTGTVFEIHETSGAERAVAGGGRYDGLVELFGGPSMPAIGFGMGDVVLGLVLRERGLLGASSPATGAGGTSVPSVGGEIDLLPRPDAFVVSAGGDDADRAVRELVSKLRRAGLHARFSYKSTRNVGKLLGEANRCRSRCAVIVGAELADGQVVVKDLASGAQRIEALDEVIRLVADLRRRAT